MGNLRIAVTNHVKMHLKDVAVLLTVFFAFANAGEADVLDLSDADFNTRVAESETTLVMFYAPW